MEKNDVVVQLAVLAELVDEIPGLFRGPGTLFADAIIADVETQHIPCEFLWDGFTVAG